MEMNCGIFVVQKLWLKTFLDSNWTCNPHLKLLPIVGLALGFFKSGLDMDRAMWSSESICV